MMDDLDRRLLDLLQTSFPIVAAPFAEIATRLEVTETDVRKRIHDLLDQGLIRRFGVSADSRKLGFVSSLVGARVCQDLLDEGIAVINSFAEVTHNYEREEELNIWFTVIARNDARKQEILNEIRAAPGVEELLDLPATHVFKINVQFQMSDAEADAPPPRSAADPTVAAAITIDDQDLELLRRLQDNLPLSSRPFAEVAVALGRDEAEVISRLQQLQAGGYVRKLGAFLRHRRAGYQANGMVVWKVAEEQVVTTGERLAADAGVSHCYARPASPRWPYRLYTMLHGSSREEVIAAAAAIAAALDLHEYRVVFSSRELKKSSPPLE